MADKKTSKAMELDEVSVMAFFAPIKNERHLRNWLYKYFDIDFPDNYIYEGSNSSPIQWMWRAYCIIRDNQANKNPNLVLYAAREIYKTLGVSAFEVLCLSHFGMTIAHMAAILSQSAKAVEYVNKFIVKVKPYLEWDDRTVISQNTRYISVMDKDGNQAYVKIITATLAGANSEHCNLLVCDELDVMRFPQAFEEAKLIPGVLNGKYPLTIMTSTRKFAFGLMQKEIDLALKNGELVLHYNLIDVTERCPEDRYLPKEPKEVRYIRSELPLANISQIEYDFMHPDIKSKYSSIEAYKGCSTCPILQVCRTKLALRNPADHGGLWKPIDFTINQFKKVSPDMGEAQLLCNKPSASGLVYGRYDPIENRYTVDQAWEAYTGEKLRKKVTYTDLIGLLRSHGIKFYCGVDWGFRHNFAIIVTAIVPTKKYPKGEWWIVDSFIAPGLEFDQQLSAAIGVRDQYSPDKWFCDTSQPMFMKTFRRNGMKCPEFKKDIKGGIESVRGQIVNARGDRFLRLLKKGEGDLLELGNNDFLDLGFKNHHFILDAQGRPTQNPDDEEYADPCDATRYLGQNLFGARGKVISPLFSPDIQNSNFMPATQQADPEAKFLQDQIQRMSGGQTTLQENKPRGILMDFGAPEDDGDNDGGILGGL